MELFVGLAGVVLGLFGSVFSVVLSIKQKKQNRLDFLVNIIIDEDIPRESRKVFYEEYVSLGGNGSVNKFWLRGEKEAAPGGKQRLRFFNKEKPQT